ncbi:MAG: hypothetical protein DRP62_05925 [Planctomycetota bacterium]|nr:MAG: hypothetical protein DRP62_05925 [Planctomycetota bacterium]
MRSSARDFEQLTRDATWLDIEDEINIWIEEIRNNLEADEISLEEVPALRGAIKALRNVLNMPLILAEQLKDEEKDDGKA